MRCAAPITDERCLSWRASRSLERRCQREAAIVIAGKWFCYQHAPVWRAHYEIVERIRSIPSRRPEGVI